MRACSKCETKRVRLIFEVQNHLSRHKSLLPWAKGPNYASVHWKVFTSKTFDERGTRSCCVLIFQAETLPVKVILLVHRNSVGHFAGFRL